MSFTSEIVFSGRQGPEEGVIKWLLNCITFGSAHATKQFSLFNSADVVDSSPVLRSYLLKLLLQYDQSDSVHRHLNQVLLQWATEKSYRMQTMVLLMDCHKVCNLILAV